MNRESEAAFLEKLNEGIAKGTSWERVTDLIQLENSREFDTSILSLYLLAFSPIADQLGHLVTSDTADDRIQNYPTFSTRWI
jgi:hypothetical protein